MVTSISPLLVLEPKEIPGKCFCENMYVWGGKERQPQTVPIVLSHHITPNVSLSYHVTGESFTWGGGGRDHCSWVLSTLRFHEIQRCWGESDEGCWEARWCQESGNQGSKRISVALRENSLNRIWKKNAHNQFSSPLHFCYFLLFFD